MQPAPGSRTLGNGKIAKRTHAKTKHGESSGKALPLTNPRAFSALSQLHFLHFFFPAILNPGALQSRLIQFNAVWRAHNRVVLKSSLCLRSMKKGNGAYHIRSLHGSFPFNQNSGNFLPQVERLFPSRRRALFNW